MNKICGVYPIYLGVGWHLYQDQYTEFVAC